MGQSLCTITPADRLAHRLTDNLTDTLAERIAELTDKLTGKLKHRLAITYSWVKIHGLIFLGLVNVPLDHQSPI